jgi:acyl-CoA thioester hydrolase
MPKPSPERLQLSTYPIHRPMELRFGDLDPLRHLNNVAVAQLYEEARVRFLDESGVRERLEPKHWFVIAELSIQYLAEGFYPDPVVLGTGVLRVGGSSFALVHALFQNGRCIGTCDSVLVYVNREEGGARPLPEAARAVLLEHSVLACSIERKEAAHAA